MYKITKHFGHEMGLSCCFRQPAAKSHCSKLHGYALAFTVVIAADRLDENNWVFDFGGFKPFKDWLHRMFDHTTIIAMDDPFMETFRQLSDQDLIDLVLMGTVGCESFAKEAFNHMMMEMYTTHPDFALNNPRNLRIESVTVHEHGGNSATYTGSV